MKPQMILEEHLETADDLAIICHYIDKVNDRLQSHYGKTSLLMKHFNKLQPLQVGGIFSSICGELDNDYNDAIDHEQYLEHGIIYGNFADRYQKLIANGVSLHIAEESDE